jgi:YggT family protein
MFVMGNFFAALAQVLDTVITIFWWLIVVRALVSWVNPDPSNTIVVFLVRVTEPILAPFRRLVPALQTGFDLSPLLAILFLMFVRYFFVQSLFGLAYRLQ